MRAFSPIVLLGLVLSAPLQADQKKWAALDKATLAEANSGQMEKARKLGEEALAVARIEFGNDDLRTAASLALLGELLMALEQWPAAEVKLRESSAIRERKLKPGHTDLEQSYNLMGRVLAAQGHYDAAERLHLKALAAAEKAAKAGEVGPHAPRWTDVIGGLHYLASFYSRLDKPEKASAMRKRAIESLALYASKDRKDHLSRLELLAQEAINEGAHSDADLVISAQLRLSENYFGAGGTVKSLRTFAGMFTLQREHARAAALYKRALAIQEKILGAEHPDVATSLFDLAELHRGEKEYDEAEKLYRRSLAIREKHLGASHADVATSLHALGELYLDQSNYSLAQPFYKRSLAIRDKQLAQHPDTAATIHNLAVTYFIDGSSEQAEALYKRALEIREKTLGPDHVDVAWSLDYLAWLYASERNYARAEPLYLRALGIMEKAYGRDDKTVVARILDNLAELYRNSDRIAEAEKLEKRAAAIRARE